MKSNNLLQLQNKQTFEVFKSICYKKINKNILRKLTLQTIGLAETYDENFKHKKDRLPKTNKIKQFYLLAHSDYV